MTTLFVGDVHSCAHELDRLLESVQPTRLILLGDMFNKGPDPLGTWSLIQRWNAEAVLGNHDVAVLQRAKQGKVSVPAGALEWLATLPLTIEGDGWIAVHAGLPPNGEAITREHAINLRRWPDDKNPSNPFWWQLYGGEKLVLYGHDAARGLQDHRPHSLGLDTGCVYGKQLTGYCLETDELVGVPAATEYQKITR